MLLRVAGAQLPVTTNIETNLANIMTAIDFAKDAKADILLTPEGSLSGYTHLFDVQHTQDALGRVTTRARETGIGLALGTCFVEPEDGKCYNQIRFYLPDGNYLGFHSKILNTGSLTNPLEGEINHFAVSPLRTFNYQGIPIGGLICNDLWANPSATPMPDVHLTQQLARLGARIIFHAVNGGRDGSEWSEVQWRYHETNLRLRANAGHVWIVTADSSEPAHLPCAAPSGVVDSQGNWVCQTAPVGLEYFSCAIDL